MMTSPHSSRARLLSRGADMVLVTVRELRLLLGLLLILFVTSETWRYVGQLAGVRLILIVIATLVAAVLVVALGLRRTLEPSTVRRATVRVAVEVIAFGALLFGTVVVIGVVSVDARLVGEWSGSAAGVVVSLSIGGPPMVLTRQLLQVAAALAALGALAFAVEVITDAGTRHTLVSDLVEPADDAPATEGGSVPDRQREERSIHDAPDLRADHEGGPSHGAVSVGDHA